MPFDIIMDHILWHCPEASARFEPSKDTTIIANFIGLLYVGVNSVTTPWFYVSVISQWYMRKYRPNWVIKYITFYRQRCMAVCNSWSSFCLLQCLEARGTQYALLVACCGCTDEDAVTFPPYWSNGAMKGTLTTACSTRTPTQVDD